jgi:hypothetical protein
MKRFHILLLTFFLPFTINAQNVQAPLVYTSDIDNFWVAYDSAKTCSDTLMQRQLIQKLYVDKRSEGLEAFMKARDYNAKLWVELINKYPKFWASIRNNTLQVKMQAQAIESSINRLKKLYPEMRPAKMYFTVGGLRSGGTTTNDMVLVGAEIASANQFTDAVELSDQFRQMFKNQQESSLIAINVHEYVHTQQKGNGNSLLAHSLREGSADFISELVISKKANSTYMAYGSLHEAELKESFKIDMFSNEMSKWLYNGSESEHADLGYFMGYSVCKSYYQNQADKKKAVKSILELNYQDSSQVHEFLIKSKYYAGSLNKPALLKTFYDLHPNLVSLSPDIASRTDVDTGITELTFNFDQVMGSGKSISFGEGGKEHFPMTGIIGYSEDRKSFKVKLSLKPDTNYSFIIMGRGFKSEGGYPIKDYTVNFKTKKVE